eukprot:s3148_g9.t1
MVALGTLAVVNFRAVTMGTLRATDASDWGMAAVACALPVPVAKEVHRLALSKSFWTKLLPPSKAWLRAKDILSPEDELPSGDVFDVHPFWEQLARSLSYVELWRKKHPKPVHVNIGELRACLREESRLATNHVSARIAFALDSQVALGCLVKGRAASKALNSELMKSIPLVIGSDLYCSYGYWPSKLNRADGPTRDDDPLPPDQPLPWWWDQVCAGDLTEFDLWLKAQENAVDDVVQTDKKGDKMMLVDLRTSRRVSYDDRCLAADGPRHRSGALQREGPLPAELCGGGLLHPGGEHPDPLHPGLPLQPPRLRADLRQHPVHHPDEGRSGQEGHGTGGALCAEAVAILRSFDQRQVLFGDGVEDFLRPGALDLYSGTAGVARGLVRGGCPWVISFEITRHPSEDLLLKTNQEKILRLIELQAVRCVGSALVCRSFSMAVTPPVRSPRFPRGVPWASVAMKEKIAEGNAMSDFNAQVHLQCEKSDPVVFFWTENPDSSYLWRQKRYKKFRNPASQNVCRVDFCRFGTPWRKRTRLGTNVPKLRGLRMLCRCVTPHQTLRGQHPTLKKPWTSVAQPYPRGFAKLIASAVLDACGWNGPFDIAKCAKCSSMRIGEAKNPGPRVSARSRAFSLEAAPVQTWASLNLGEQRWSLFLQWAHGFLSGDPLALFLSVPLFLAHAIRRYGDLDFMAGGSLLYYRHLVLAAQRKVPSLKPFVSICWDLATRWEKVEPTKHRPPVPEIMVEALVSLAWQLGWRRWSSITMLCFYGVARAGEVLKCQRRDLLLPADMMFESNCAFLLLRQSKTMYRQLAKVQHLKISSPFVVRLLACVYRDADRDEQLFHGSPHVYRQRWNFLLKLMQVPSDLRITPGGLRGGGAVSWYRKGGSISELMWLMRLKQIATLEAYLQEVSAISLLTDLPFASRRALRRAAAENYVLAAFAALTCTEPIWRCGKEARIPPALIPAAPGMQGDPMPAALLGVSSKAATLAAPSCNAPHGRWSDDVGVCICQAPYHGESCEEKHCPDWDGTEGGKECSGNGVCQQGKCFCLPGFGLANQSSKAENICADVVCPADCGAHGSCEDGQCRCEPGWQGSTCREPQCEDECNGHGLCIFPQPGLPGACRCEEDYLPPTCAERRQEVGQRAPVKERSVVAQDVGNNMAVDIVRSRCQASHSRRWLAAACVACIAWRCHFSLDALSFARVRMTVGEAWRQLKVQPTSSKEQVKKAFKERIRQVHPDVTGDDGTMLRKVQDAYQILEELRDPTIYDASSEDGLPHWAAGLLEGIEWSSDCPSYAEFLRKPDNKALAVGEISQRTGIRPWAAAWGKFSQQDANSEALRVCRQMGVKCRLVYVGSGTARVRTVGLDSRSTEEEKSWWRDQVMKSGDLPGFGWMPTIDPSKERLVGWKTIKEGSGVIGEQRIRVPVFEPVTGGTPYLYAPGKPKQRVEAACKRQLPLFQEADALQTCAEPSSRCAAEQAFGAAGPNKR